MIIVISPICKYIDSDGNSMTIDYFKALNIIGLAKSIDNRYVLEYQVESKDDDKNDRQRARDVVGFFKHVQEYGDLASIKLGFYVLSKIPKDNVGKEGGASTKTIARTRTRTRTRTTRTRTRTRARATGRGGGGGRRRRRPSRRSENLNERSERSERNNEISAFKNSYLNKICGDILVLNDYNYQISHWLSKSFNKKNTCIHSHSWFTDNNVLNKEKMEECGIVTLENIDITKLKESLVGGLDKNGDNNNNNNDICSFNNIVILMPIADSNTNNNNNNEMIKNIFQKLSSSIYCFLLVFCNLLSL